jgi:chemotaxis signal transduction protein
MNAEPEPQSANELRRAFDEMFTRSAEARDERAVEVLSIRAGMTRMVLPVLSIRAVQLCPEIATVPSGVPSLLGVSGLRGSVVAMYSLAQLIGGAKAPVGGAWVALCGDGTVGLVFDELFGHERLTQAELLPGEGEASRRFVEINGTPHVLVDVKALLKAITAKE